MSQLRVNNFSNHFVLDVKINATNILHCFIYMYCQYWLFIVQQCVNNVCEFFIKGKYPTFVCLLCFSLHARHQENYFTVIAILKTNKEITPF